MGIENTWIFVIFELLFVFHKTNRGEVITSTQNRDWLFENKYIDGRNGYFFVTSKGIDLINKIGNFMMTESGRNLG